MKLTRRSTLADVVAAVAGALQHAGIAAVLTGGACATLYSRGAYQSQDLDFIIRGGGTRGQLADAMASAGFVRKGDRYVHPATPFFVEFPRGPLAIGDDIEITPVELRFRGVSAMALSPTDACRDRLAAFFHWSDRQSLHVAVAIALRQRVNLTAIRRWSHREGFDTKFDEFRRELKRKRPTVPTQPSAPPPDRPPSRTRRAPAPPPATGPGRPRSRPRS